MAIFLSMHIFKQKTKIRKEEEEAEEEDGREGGQTHEKGDLGLAVLVYYGEISFSTDSEV